MKFINEYSIGDWVDYKGKPVKITALSSRGLAQINYDETEWISMSRFLPICLSPYVLKDNGWECSSNEHDYYLKVHDERTTIEMHTDHATCNMELIYNIKKGDRVWSGYVAFVHHLQHILLTIYDMDFIIPEYIKNFTVQQYHIDVYNRR